MKKGIKNVSQLSNRVLALWKGTTPNMIRNVILNIMEVVTFDEVYSWLSAYPRFGPGILSLIIASGVFVIVRS